MVALESHQYSEGDVLHMKLMKRRKVCGGLTHQPGEEEYYLVLMLCVHRAQIMHCPSLSGAKRCLVCYFPKVRGDAHPLKVLTRY